MTTATVAGDVTVLLGHDDLPNTVRGMAVVKDPMGYADLGAGVYIGTLAVLAYEAGLVGATFTSTHYEALTAPIDAVLAMPSGY